MARSTFLLAPTVRLAGVEADKGLLAAARRNLVALVSSTGQGIFPAVVDEQ